MSSGPVLVLFILLRPFHRMQEYLTDILPPNFGPSYDRAVSPAPSLSMLGQPATAFEAWDDNHDLLEDLKAVYGANMPTDAGSFILQEQLDDMDDLLLDCMFSERTLLFRLAHCRSRPRSTSSTCSPSSRAPRTAKVSKATCATIKRGRGRYRQQNG